MEEKELIAHARPYFHHSLEFKGIVTRGGRAEVRDDVGLKFFCFLSEPMTERDFLSDFGTATVTNEQWLADSF